MSDETQIRSMHVHSTTFSRTYTMFGFLVTALVSFHFVLDESFCVIVVIICIITYYYVENKLKVIMKKMESSSSYFNRTPIEMIPYGITAIIESGIIGYIIIKKNWVLENFIKTYLYELILSLTLFLFGTGIKCMLLGTGTIGYKSTRRGFFGIYQRLFILIRNYFVMPKWIEYFSDQEYPCLSMYFTSRKKSIYLLCYFVLKCFVQLWLLWDIGYTLKNYSVNAKSAFLPVNELKKEELCVICQDFPNEPIKLACEHIFCYKCIYRWTREHNTCPICRKEITKMNDIEFADGYMPNSVLFFPF